MKINSYRSGTNFIRLIVKIAIIYTVVEKNERKTNKAFKVLFIFKSTI